jgi:uncharacterized LabA/DUF88 family protein
MTLVMIDTEYCFTVAMRDGMVPNYKSIIDYITTSHPVSKKIAYFVGPKERKQGIVDFLIKSGFEFVVLHDLSMCSKTQIVAASMGIDLAELVWKEKIDHVAFVSGDDYLIPMCEHLEKKNIEFSFYYSPYILCKELQERFKNKKYNRLGASHFLFSKKNEKV